MRHAKISDQATKAFIVNPETFSAAELDDDHFLQKDDGQAWDDFNYMCRKAVYDLQKDNVLPG